MTRVRAFSHYSPTPSRRASRLHDIFSSSVYCLGEVSAPMRTSFLPATVAFSMFEALGAPLWAAKARASLARISGRTATVGLTESERQTVVLAMEGRTNREIAESMFVSVRTVEANLSRAYAKLGVGSRRELRADLLPPAPQHP